MYRNARHIVKAHPRLGEELIKPFPRIIVVGQGAVVHGRSYQLHVQLLSHSHQARPVFSGPGWDHIGLIRKVRLIVGQDVFALGVRLLERAEGGFLPVGVPYHRTIVQAEAGKIAECLCRGGRSPVVGPADARSQKAYVVLRQLGEAEAHSPLEALRLESLVVKRLKRRAFILHAGAKGAQRQEYSCYCVPIHSITFDIL